MVEQRTYRQGEPDLNRRMTCRIDTKSELEEECGAKAVSVSQGKGSIMWCREGHISAQVWTEVTYEWVILLSNYPWE